MIYLMNEDQEYIALVGCEDQGRTWFDVCTTKDAADASHFETVEHAELFKDDQDLWEFNVVETD